MLQPRQVRCATVAYRKGDDFGNFVGVKRRHAIAQRGKERSASFDDLQDLGVVAQFSLPGVDGTQTGDDVHAGGEFFADDRMGDGCGHFGVWRGDKDDDKRVGRGGDCT